jgi:hypothetical protein
VSGAVKDKVSPETMDRVRGALKGHEGKSLREKGEVLLSLFPGAKPSTLRDYSRMAACDSEVIWDHFNAGRLSYMVCLELVAGPYDDVTRDFIANEMVQNGYTYTHLRKIKSYLRGGEVSVEEAIRRSVGFIPEFERAKEAEKSVKDLKSLSDDIQKMGFEFRGKIQLFLDVLPGTTLEKGKALSSIFETAFMTRFSLRETLSFLDEMVKQFFDEVRGFNITESILEQERRDRIVKGGKLNGGDEEESQEQEEGGEEEGKGGREPDEDVGT